MQRKGPGLEQQAVVVVLGAGQEEGPQVGSYTEKVLPSSTCDGASFLAKSSHSEHAQAWGTHALSSHCGYGCLETLEHDALLPTTNDDDLVTTVSDICAPIDYYRVFLG